MNRITAIIVSILLLFSLTSCIYTESDIEEARDSGYDEGYETGYDEGYDLGYDEGYDDGYSDGLYDSSESDMSGYLGPRDTYLTTDTAPSGTVWVTPSGEKYHEGWCRYISGRNDLTYYYSAEDAINAGYAPCSVCH